MHYACCLQAIIIISMILGWLIWAGLEELNCEIQKYMWRTLQEFAICNYCIDYCVASWISDRSIGGSVELPFARMHNVNYLLCISDNICQNLAGYCSHRMLYVGILEAVYKLLLKFCKGEGYGTVYNSHGSRHLMNKFFCPFLQTPSQIPRSTTVKLSHTGFCLPEG